ncbi:uncharacterized protein GGS25DRAFT_324260 [Hypoxylon fragiforme]|uniref:uncharacterized protein n=1 Tax=Hypoxylon fragiforme TaxID=63214 RepID=UPI0020C6B485|nr:uncharacterized protein GGS25DRAFT_324260 [Hypoxylon fragiforme]KAI2607250.1 hypothetical protein GGS25DRAFT_324260 [Hypoxylon fragiforme]
MAEIPVIQILEKKNYFKQALVPLPSALPLPPLADSSLRIRTETLCLSTNNFSYCKVGDLFGWWDVHPLPPSAPSPYTDAATYGRTNCWGYARVVDSTFADVQKGSYVWGYLPIGTLPLDLEVKAAAEAGGQVVVTEGYRQKQLAIYNRYAVYPPGSAVAAEVRQRSDAVAYDCLLRVMHLTAFVMTEVMFPPEAQGADGADGFVPPHLADLAGATVLSFAPGSKVGLAFAMLLRSEGRGGGRPRRVVGVASEASVAFVKGTGVYGGEENVVATTEEPLAVLEGFGAPRDGRVVICDFGGRNGVAWKWARAIKAVFPRTMYVAVGGEVTDPTATATGEGEGGPDPEVMDFAFAHAGILQDMAMKKFGEGEYFRRLGESWEGMRKTGIKGFRVTWGEGMQAVKEGWERYTRGEVGSDEGLVFGI